MADKRVTMTPERAREIGRLGRQKSPWGNEPSCTTKKAAASFKKHSRLRLIEQIAKAAKQRETP